MPNATKSMIRQDRCSFTSLVDVLLQYWTARFVTSSRAPFKVPRLLPRQAFYKDRKKLC